MANLEVAHALVGGEDEHEGQADGDEIAPDAPLLGADLLGRHRRCRPHAVVAAAAAAAARRRRRYYERQNRRR